MLGCWPSLVVNGEQWWAEREDSDRKRSAYECVRCIASTPPRRSIVAFALRDLVVDVHSGVAFQTPAALYCGDCSTDSGVYRAQSLGSAQSFILLDGLFTAIGVRRLHR